MKEVIIKRYEALDGTIFDSEQDCELYEIELEINKNLKKFLEQNKISREEYDQICKRLGITTELLSEVFKDCDIQKILENALRIISDYATESESLKSVKILYFQLKEVYHNNYWNRD